MKKTLSQASLALLLCLFAFSCGKDEPTDPVDTTGPKINSFSPTTGTVGTTIWITGTNFGATTAANTVKIGTVTAPISSASTSEIFVTVPEGAQTGAISVTAGGKTDTAGTFTVTVAEPDPTTVSLDQETLELKTLDTDQLVATVAGAGANETVVWSSDNEEAALVDQEGNVTATGAGTATITATVDGVTASCSVTVDPSIIVAGTIKGNGNNYTTLGLWVNGIFHETTYTESFSPSIDISEGNIYLSYAEKVDDDVQMKVTKNESPISEWDFGAWPENGGYERVPTSIDVIASDIYVSGYEVSHYGNPLDATGYWKSATEKTVLIDGIDQSIEYPRIEDILVKNNTVYAAGHYRINTFDYGFYFVGGEIHVIGSGQITGVKLSSLDIDSSENIYTAGSINDVATVWKNGSTLYTLGDEGKSSTIKDIKVMNGNTVSVGHVLSEGGKIWFNDQLIYESNDGSAQAIASHNGLFYIAGHKSGTTKVWVMNATSGEITDEISLPSDMFEVGYDYSIIVK